MNLLLKSLKVSNFKGIKQFSLLFNSTETKLHGANGAGKTTVADAFFFIFTGSDIQDKQAKEWIQTLDSTNNKLHKLNHEAEVIIAVDGDVITLGRKVSEKWVKPRGEKEEVLDETLDYTYYIDGVATPARQFEKFLLEVVFGNKFTPKEFALLSNPLAFCSMDWKKQREILYKVCGSATDEEVIATDERFNFLLDALKHKDIETLKAALRKSIKTTQDEIKALDAVIKDRKNSLVKEHDRQDLLIDKADKEGYIADLNKQLEGAEVKYQELREKQKLVLDLEETKTKKKKEYEEEYFKEHDEASAKLLKLQTEIQKLTTRKENITATIEKANQENIILDKQIERARNEWKTKDGEQLPDGSTICPCCGQDMPEHKVEEITLKFSSDKALALEGIVIKANQLKANRGTNDKVIAINEKMYGEVDIEMRNIQEVIEKLSIIANQEVEVKPFDSSKFDAEIAEARAEIEAFKAEDNSEIKEKIEFAQKDLQLIAVKLNKCDMYDQSVKDIEIKEVELKDKQSALADLEMQLINTNDFITTKVKILEEKVNSKFETVKFKLFKQNMKGNWEETCTALVDGVDWNISNTAAKVQSGIEIINTLQKHFDFYCPIWVDNKESVTELPGVNGQLISLVVSENDKELRVE